MSEDRLLDALTCRGVLVNVSVRYWRARKKLSPADLGLPDDKVNRRLISLGHKRLLPKDRLAGLALVESRAHALVDANTFPFLNGIARYLPNERLAEVDAALNDLKSQFEAERREFLAGYAAYRDEALEEWRETARGLVPDPSRLVAAIEDAFPPPGLMDRHFGFHISLFQLAVPDVPKADLVEAGGVEPPSWRDVIEGIYMRSSSSSSRPSIWAPNEPLWMDQQSVGSCRLARLHGLASQPEVCASVPYRASEQRRR